MYKLGRYQFDREKMFDEVCEANGQKGVENISVNASPNNPSSFTCQLTVGKRKQDMKTVVIAPDGDYYLTDGHHTFNVFYGNAGRRCGLSYQRRCCERLP